MSIVLNPNILHMIHLITQTLINVLSKYLENHFKKGFILNQEDCFSEQIGLVESQESGVSNEGIATKYSPSNSTHFKEVFK